MMLEAIFGAIGIFLVTCFSWIDIPSLSDYSTGLEDALSLIGEMLLSAQSLINMILPWDIVRFGFPVIIFVLSFESIYNLVLWVLKKIPVLGIE